MKKLYLLIGLSIIAVLSACSSSSTTSSEKPHQMTVKLNNFSKAEKSQVKSTEKVGVMPLNKKQQNDLQARLNDNK